MRPPNTKVSGIMLRPPSPPPPPPPTPGPVPAGSQKNIIFLVNDDQDLVLGSMKAMPNTVKLLGAAGANLTQFRVNTPICCPSRTTMLSGRYEHNNHVATPSSGGCMRQNTSRVDNPSFWEHSVVKQLHDHGYITGAFGKVLNDMDSYGCDGVSGLPPGLDRSLVMCTHTFFNCSWVNDSTLVFTGDEPENYTTSIVGNASVDWLRSVLEMGDTHPPAYLWIGPHAPHLPATPAPWYEDHPIGLLKAPRTVHYNYSATDHHPLVAQQPILNGDDADSIDAEYSKRMRSLLSVDDIVVALHKLLVEFNEWDNTYFFFSSDHGYSLGQYRLPTHKMQVYDNNLRVPFLARGPGILPQQIDSLTMFADLCPTILTLAGAPIPFTVDGRSFAHMLDPSIPAPAKPWKDTHIAEYLSINVNHCERGDSLSACARHTVDDATNTYRAMRVRNSTHDFLYAEFTDVTVASDWSFPPSGIQFVEYYDMRNDPYQLHNLYQSMSSTTQRTLRDRLQELYTCQGNDCP